MAINDHDNANLHHFLNVCKGRILLEDLFDRGVEPCFQLRITRAIVYVVLGGKIERGDQLEFYETRQVDDPFVRDPELDIDLSVAASENIKDQVPGSAGRNLADVVSHLLEIIGLEGFEEGRHVLEDPKLADFLGEGQSVVCGFAHKSVFLVCKNKDGIEDGIYQQ